MTVFDFGEVLSLPSQALPVLAARLGVAQEDFEPAYWAEREAYERRHDRARQGF